MAHLRISDIDSKNNLITIHQSKRNKTRVVKLSQACLDVLRKYWLLYRPTDYFFPGKKENRHIATATVNDWFNQYIKKFSFYNKSIHYHSLRHTFATNMLENGCDIFLLKKLLGEEFALVRSFDQNPLQDIFICRYLILNLLSLCLMSGDCSNA